MAHNRMIGAAFVELATIPMAQPIRRSGAQCWPGKAGLGMRPGRLGTPTMVMQPCEPRRLADTSPLAVDALAAGV